MKHSQLKQLIKEEIRSVLGENQLSLFSPDSVKKDPTGDDNTRTEKETRLLPQLKKAIDKEINNKFGKDLKWEYVEDPERTTWNDGINGAWVNFLINIFGDGKYSKGKSAEFYGKWLLDAGKTSSKSSPKPGSINITLHHPIKNKDNILALYEDPFMDLPWPELKKLEGEPNDYPGIWEELLDEDHFLFTLDSEYPGNYYKLWSDVYKKYINKYKKVNKIGLLRKLGIR